ncbi:unnamed protein product [Pedinophyceae sp. YPF-701]|nr:unnamed protein product [Pedinophyceae sp. YPF-701]
MSHRRDHALPEQSTPPRTSSSVPATHKATAFAGATNAAGAPAAALRLSQLPCAAATQGAPPPAGAALVDRSQGRRSSQDRLRFADRSQRGGRQQRGRPDARTAQNDDAGADAPSHGIDGGPPPPSASRRASASFAGKAAAAGPAPPEAAALGVDGLMFEPHGSPAAARGVRGPEDGLPAAPRVGGGAPRSAVVMCHGDALSPRGGQPGSRVAAEAKAATLRPDASGVLGSFGRSFTAPRTSLDRRSLSTLRALSTSTSRRSSTQKTGTVSPAGSTEVALQRAASGSKHAPSVALEVSRSALLAALRQMAADAALPAPAESAAEAKKRSWLSAIRGVHVQLGEGCGRYDTRNAYFLVGPKRRVLLSDVRGLARLFYAAVNAEQRRDGTVSRAMLVGLAQRQGAKHLGMAAGVLKRAIAEPTSALGEARPSVTLRELLAAAFHPATPTELALLSCECLGASLGERQLGTSAVSPAARPRRATPAQPRQLVILSDRRMLPPLPARRPHERGVQGAGVLLRCAGARDAGRPAPRRHRGACVRPRGHCAGRARPARQRAHPRPPAARAHAREAPRGGASRLLRRRGLVEKHEWLLRRAAHPGRRPAHRRGRRGPARYDEVRGDAGRAARVQRRR